MGMFDWDEDLIIDREAKEIMHLVASVRLSSWSTSSDIWKFCLTTQEPLVRHFLKLSEMSDVTNGFFVIQYAVCLLLIIIL